MFNITYEDETPEEEPEEAVTTEVVEAVIGEVKEELKEEPVQVTLIENPLPLPKKHVKKRLDFAFEPAPEEMNYDFDVDDNDTYDIE